MSFSPPQTAPETNSPLRLVLDLVLDEHEIVPLGITARGLIPSGLLQLCGSPDIGIQRLTLDGVRRLKELVDGLKGKGPEVLDEALLIGYLRIKHALGNEHDPETLVTHLRLIAERGIEGYLAVRNAIGLLDLALQTSCGQELILTEHDLERSSPPPPVAAVAAAQVL